MCRCPNYLRNTVDKLAASVCRPTTICCVLSHPTANMFCPVTCTALHNILLSTCFSLIFSTWFYSSRWLILNHKKQKLARWGTQFRQMKEKNHGCVRIISAVWYFAVIILHCQHFSSLFLYNLVVLVKEFQIIRNLVRRDT
jgi:hypothetical protein